MFITGFIIGFLFGMFTMATMVVADDNDGVLIQNAYEEGYRDGLKHAEEKDE